MSFQKVSGALVHMLKDRYVVTRVVKYLDDFLFFGRSEQECRQQLACFYDLCAEIGCPIALHKTVGPATALTFLGYAVDSKAMLVAIPPMKIESYKSDLEDY